VSSSFGPIDGEAKQAAPPGERAPAGKEAGGKTAAEPIGPGPSRDGPGGTDDPKAPGAATREPDARSPGGFRDSPEKQYNFIGGSFNATSFGGDFLAEKLSTWAEELKEVDRRWLVGGSDALDPVFEQARETWARFHILVLRYHPGERRRAEDLMQRVTRWAGEAEPGRKLLSTGNHLALHLKELALPEVWPKTSHHSLIFLARRNDPHTARFFSMSNGVEVKGLRQRLESTDTRLVVSLAAEWDAVEGALDAFDDGICTLEVASARRRSTPTVDDRADSAFDGVPRIIAGLFAGLKVGEYRDLVGQFLPPLPEPAAPPVKPDGKPDEAARQPVPPTRHERWLAGDVDRVLAELGIRYEMAAGDAGTHLGDRREAGYYLDDDASPYADPGWVIANHPALLEGRVDQLLARYLGARTASRRYQEAFVACLARMDAAGIHEVSARWLADGWAAALDASADADLAARRLGWLVEYLQSGRKDPERLFAREVVDAFAGDAAELELRFQLEQGDAPVRRALEALAQDDGTVPVQQLWGRLVDDPESGPPTRRFADKQAATIWALLQLARSWPAEVARAIGNALSRVIDPASPWRLLARELDALDHVPRSAALNVKHLLVLMLEVAPGRWTSFAEGVIEAFSGAIERATAKESSSSRLSPAQRDAACTGQRLAFACLDSIAPLLYGADAEKKSRVLRQLCVGGGDAAHNPAALGRLLAMSYFPVDEAPMLGPLGEGSPALGDIVRFLCGIAETFHGDETLSPPHVNEALAQIAAGSRTLMSLASRRALAAQAREGLEAQSAIRDQLEAIGERSALATIRKSIRASQAVIRSLGAGK
jgi:hypothetical protein